MDFSWFTHRFSGPDSAFFVFMTAAAAFPILALAVAAAARARVRSFPVGDPALERVAKSVRRGATAFLRTKALLLVLLVLVVTGLLLVFVDWPRARASETASFEFTTALKHGVAGCFLLGTVLSATVGWIALRAASGATVRTAAAARVAAADAFRVAFAASAGAGFVAAGLGLLGVLIAYLWIGRADQLFGLALGVSTVSFLARVGGGIFRKAARAGAAEAGSGTEAASADDSRNPAHLADAVGKEVGGAGGAGADLFESYVTAIVAAMALGALSLSGAGPERGALGKFEGMALVFLPVGLAAVGLLAAIAGAFAVRAGDETRLPAALFRGTLCAAAVFALLAGGLVHVLDLFENEAFRNVAFERDADGWPHPGGIYFAVLSGVVLAVLAGKVGEFQARRPAPGPGAGMGTVVLPVLLVGAAVHAAWWFAGLYGVGLAAVGMVSTLGLSYATAFFGPVAANARDLSAATAGAVSPERPAGADTLDGAGRAAAPGAHAFSIVAAALAALSLLVAFAWQFPVHAAGLDRLQLDLLSPRVLVGLLLGGALPFLFSAMTMRAAGRAGRRMSDEAKRQFAAIPGLAEGTAEPLVGRCVAIGARGALFEALGPGLIATAAPLAVGFLLGATALGGFLAGAILSGLLLANYLAKAGGGPEDAPAGAGLNALLKFSAVVSLVFIPLFASYGPLI